MLLMCKSEDLLDILLYPFLTRSMSGWFFLFCGKTAAVMVMPSLRLSFFCQAETVCTVVFSILAEGICRSLPPTSMIRRKRHHI